MTLADADAAMTLTLTDAACILSTVEHACLQPVNTRQPLFTGEINCKDAPLGSGMTLADADADCLTPDAEKLIRIKLKKNKADKD